MFDADATVVLALVLAKCSSEDWIFGQNLDTRVKILKSCQNIDDWSKYVKQIWSSIFWVNVFFDKKRNLPHTVKNPSKLWCQLILTVFLFFWSSMGTFRLIPWPSIIILFWFCWKTFKTSSRLTIENHSQSILFKIWTNYIPMFRSKFSISFAIYNHKYDFFTFLKEWGSTDEKKISKGNFEMLFLNIYLGG